MMTVIEKEMPATQFGQIKLQPGHPGEKDKKEGILTGNPGKCWKVGSPVLGGGRSLMTILS